MITDYEMQLKLFKILTLTDLLVIEMNDERLTQSTDAKEYLEALEEAQTIGCKILDKFYENKEISKSTVVVDLVNKLNFNVKKEYDNLIKQLKKDLKNENNNK